MTEGSGAKDAPHPFTDKARAQGIDGVVHPDLVLLASTGHTYWSTAIAVAVVCGLASVASSLASRQPFRQLQPRSRTGWSWRRT